MSFRRTAAGFLSAIAVLLAIEASPARAETVAEMPVAPPGVAFDAGQTLVRIALGSCAGQDQPQSFWTAIAATRPQLFLMMGDNVYGDLAWQGDAGLASFRSAYAKLANHREFQAFRSRVPMRAVWDDHDYGPNDSGGDFAYKSHSEQLFETFRGAGESVRARPGIYDSLMAGPEGRRIQIILLDSRFFRSPLQQVDPAGPPVRGRYRASDDPDAQVLGEAQWHWLANELAKPAELRLVVSSIQVLSQAHNFERWANFPKERARLLSAIGKANGGQTIILSGDRHSAAIYRTALPGHGRDLWEFTSSSLNRPNRDADVDRNEPDPLRATRLIPATNFGLVDVDWAQRAAIMRVLNDKGQEFYSRTIPF